MSDKSSDFGAIMSSCVNLAAALGFPVIAPFVGIVNPILQRIFERSFMLVNKNNTAQIECARLGIAYMQAVSTIQSNLDEGNRVRTDGFLEEINGIEYTIADDILEATLRNVVTDAESKKAAFYGTFIGNIPFSDDSFEEFINLNAILRQLTCSEIEQLKHIREEVEIDFTNLENLVRTRSATAVRQYSEVLHLKNVGAIIQHPMFQLGSTLGKERCTRLGERILRILNLI